MKKLSQEIWTLEDVKKISKEKENNQLIKELEKLELMLKKCRKEKD